MIAALIRWSARNVALVLIGAVLAAAAGIHAVRQVQLLDGCLRRTVLKFNKTLSIGHRPIDLAGFIKDKQSTLRQWMRFVQDAFA
jgi:hypothetical protein